MAAGRRGLKAAASAGFNPLTGFAGAPPEGEDLAPPRRTHYIGGMRQTFDETTDPSFGPKHLPLIRKAMAEQGLDALLVPHEDEHQNEYLPPANDRLGWATGFTGSAGAAVIFQDKAAIFVDGRYTLQVRDQVDQATFEIRDLGDG